MPDEPQRYSVISIKVDSSGFSWENAKLVYSDGYAEDQAKILAKSINDSPEHEAFAIPISLRKHYFTDLLTSLRLAEKESSK